MNKEPLAGTIEQEDGYFVLAIMGKELITSRMIRPAYNFDRDVKMINDEVESWCASRVDEALEEAAKTCETIRPDEFASHFAADRIRALKSHPQVTK